MLIGMYIVDVNPILDVHNQTALLAVEFIRSALGRVSGASNENELSVAILQN
jgi:arginase family enzyme